MTLTHDFSRGFLKKIKIHQMKKIKIILISVLAIILSNVAHAQTNTVRIQTSAICEQCKERIENDLSFEKGVKSSTLDLKTKVITVIYNPKKTDEQKIREAITKIGYDADTLKADLKAYGKLPNCCKHNENK
jgi:mercuric ion binding protein